MPSHCMARHDGVDRLRIKPMTEAAKRPANRVLRHQQQPAKRGRPLRGHAFHGHDAS